MVLVDANLLLYAYDQGIPRNAVAEPGGGEISQAGP